MDFVVAAAVSLSRNVVSSQMVFLIIRDFVEFFLYFLSLKVE